jgi:hypothetical protein
LARSFASADGVKLLYAALLAEEQPAQAHKLLVRVEKMHGELMRETRVKALFAAHGRRGEGTTEHAQATQHKRVARADRKVTSRGNHAMVLLGATWSGTGSNLHGAAGDHRTRRNEPFHARSIDGCGCRLPCMVALGLLQA